MHTMAPEALKLSQVGSMGWTLVGGRGYQRLHIASFMPSAAQNIADLYWKEYLAYIFRVMCVTLFFHRMSYNVKTIA